MCVYKPAEKAGGPIEIRRSAEARVCQSLDDETDRHFRICLQRTRHSESSARELVCRNCCCHLFLRAHASGVRRFPQSKRSHIDRVFCHASESHATSLNLYYIALYRVAQKPNC